MAPPAPPIDRTAPGRGGSARIDEVDALRGFALLGILMANVMAVSGLMSIRFEGIQVVVPFDGSVDQWVGTVVTGLFLGKFFLLFSFLFGYSFTLQLDAATRAGVSPVPRLLRRCAALFALGAAHVALLWFGDILTLYALLGLVLVALRNVRPAVAVGLGCGILVALFVDNLWSLSLFPAMSDDLGWFFEAAQHGPGFTGGFLDTLRASLAVGPRFATDVIWPGQGPQALALFLFGFAAGKRRLLQDVDALRPWLGRVQAVGLLVGGSVAAWVAIAEHRGDELPDVVAAVVPITDALLTAFYIATVLRLCRGRAGGRLRGRCAGSGWTHGRHQLRGPVGRVHGPLHRLRPGARRRRATARRRQPGDGHLRRPARRQRLVAPPPPQRPHRVGAPRRHLRPTPPLAIRVAHIADRRRTGSDLSCDPCRP
jgi:uncharacterized protein